MLACLFQRIFSDVTMLVIISITLNLLSFVFTVVSLIIPSWFYWSTTVHGLTAYVRFGLWKWCGEIPLFVSRCNILEDIVHPISIQIQTARAMIVMSSVPTFMAAGFSFMSFFRRSNRRYFLLAAGICAGVSGFTSIVGTVVFVVDNQIKTYFDEEEGGIPQINLKPHVSFALCLTAGLLNLIEALLYIVDAFCINGNSVTNMETRVDS